MKIVQIAGFTEPNKYLGTDSQGNLVLKDGGGGGGGTDTVTLQGYMTSSATSYPGNPPVTGQMGVGSGALGAIQKGNAWWVKDANTIIASKKVKIGTLLIAITNNPANSDTDWLLQEDLDANFELLANKSNNITADQASTTKYPTTKTVWDYIQTVISSISAALNLKADINSPTFTGIPLAPTASPGTNTTQIATTEFVTDAISVIPEIDPNLNLSINTGVITGGALSINAAPTKFNVSDGSGVIVDMYSDPDPANAIVYNVSWSGLNAQTVTNIATSTVTFVLIDNTGSLVQLTTLPDEADLRDYIYLGQLGHSNLTSIATATSQPLVAQSALSQLRDLWTAIQYINDGNLISANGANLSINKSNGNLIGLGLGFQANNKTPNFKNYPAQTLATIRRRTQTGGSGTNTTLDVANYDLSGTVTAISGTKSQNQRVFLLPTGNIVIQYGQTLYNSLTDAIQGIENETFVQLENTKVGQLIAIISVTSNWTSLQDSSRARIKNVGKFGETSVGAGSSSVSTMNQTYLNSIDPEIDTTNGAVSFKNGGANDTVDVFEVKNLANTKTFSVDGNGTIFSNSLTASTLAFINASKQIVTALGTTFGTWLNGLTAKTTVVDADVITTLDSASSFEAKKTTLLQLWTNYLLGKVQALGYLAVSGLTTSRLQYWNGTTLVDSRLVRATDDSTISFIPTSGSNTLSIGNAGIRLTGGNIDIVSGSFDGLLVTGRIINRSSDNYAYQVSNSGSNFYFGLGGTNTGVFRTVSNICMSINDNGVAIGTGSVNARSQLHLQATNKGFLPNVLTTAQRDAVSWVAGDAGMIIYNSTTNKHQGWNGTTWNDMY